MAKQPSRFAIDLGNHFQARLHAIMADTADTGRRGDMSDRDVASVLVSVLQAEAATGAIALEVNEENYAVLAAYAHRTAIKSRAKSHPPQRRRTK